MNANLENKLAEYEAKFNEIFPVFQAPDDEKEVIAIIDNAIKAGKPYEPEFEEDAIY